MTKETMMEASTSQDAPVVETSSQFDPSAIHGALDAAERAYHDIFDGHVPAEIHRFGAFLSTVRMIVDQSADSASKEQ